MCESLDKYFGNTIEYKKPIGGIYIWVSFPEQVDTNFLYTKAMESGVAINPGSEWSMEKESKNKIFVFPSMTKIFRPQNILIAE